MPFALPRCPSMSSSQVPQAAAVEKTARAVRRKSGMCFLRGLHMFFVYLLGWWVGFEAKHDESTYPIRTYCQAYSHIQYTYILATNKPYLTHTIRTVTSTRSKPNHKHLGGSTNHHWSQVKFVFCSRHPSLAR